MHGCCSIWPFSVSQRGARKEWLLFLKDQFHRKMLAHQDYGQKQGIREEAERKSEEGPEWELRCVEVEKYENMKGLGKKKGDQTV